MGRPKIARKSTWVDMTAFCDVAFLLLSFFIMATKTKPAEAIQVTMPSSVSSKAVEDKDQVLVTIAPDGKVFLSLSEEDRRVAIVEDVARLKGLALPPEIAKKAAKMEFFGAPIAQLGSYLNLEKDQLKGNLLPGIPVQDTANNELVYWMTAAYNVFQGQKMNLLVKGDNAAKYPAFKSVIDAFKKNDMMKFSVITNSENVPMDSELAKRKKAESSGTAPKE
ncbi:MAG TPA: biopolymer transporter ExbD [Phnomibacter sp.]|nr:biopolymer transporter ExbD [Phnomibacter sp.]